MQGRAPAAPVLPTRLWQQPVPCSWGPAPPLPLRSWLFTTTGHLWGKRQSTGGTDIIINNNSNPCVHRELACPAAVSVPPGGTTHGHTAGTGNPHSLGRSLWSALCAPGNTRDRKMWKPAPALPHPERGSNWALDRVHACLVTWGDLPRLGIIGWVWVCILPLDLFWVEGSEVGSSARCLERRQEGPWRWQALSGGRWGLRPGRQRQVWLAVAAGGWVPAQQAPPSTSAVNPPGGLQP